MTAQTASKWVIRFQTHKTGGDAWNFHINTPVTREEAEAQAAQVAANCDRVNRFHKWETTVVSIKPKK